MKRCMRLIQESVVAVTYLGVGLRAAHDVAISWPLEPPWEDLLERRSQHDVEAHGPVHQILVI